MASKRKQRRERPPKKPLSRRVGDHLDALGSLGRTAIDRPRELPSHAGGLFRRWFRNVWSVRGGGLYAVGFAAAFLYLETVDIVFDDVPTLFSMNILSADLVGFIVSFFIDTFLNMLSALAWPVFVVAFAPPWGAIALAVAFVAFNYFLKKPVERWLDDDEPADGPAAESPGER
jgi:hypothetical protein